MWLAMLLSVLGLFLSLAGRPAATEIEFSCWDGWKRNPGWFRAARPADGIFYALILCDEKGEIARNGYSSGAAYPDERSRVMDASGCLSVEWRKPIIIA